MQPFTSKRAGSLAALGEIGLIEKIRRWLGRSNPPSPRGIGDDCAVLPPSALPQVITVDPIVFGRHFDASVAPELAGAKLLKRNVSDIAAMGARPQSAVISLAVDPSVSARWLERFYRGLSRAALHYGVQIVGGDVAQASRVLIATLTLLGRASGKRVLTRTGARIGDRIYVTGQLGGSRAGHHLRFEPRVAEGAWLAAQPEVRSMIDLSDGLAKDVFALVPPRARPALEPSLIPISAAARKLARADGRSLLDHALCDGEDYELLFTVAASAHAASFEKRWTRKFRTPLTCVGQIASERAVRGEEIDWSHYRGYEHLR